MVDQKDTEDFLIRLAGALTGAAEDAAFEGNFKATAPPANTFPYVTVISPLLPPGDDLLVGGLSLPPWLIGWLVEEDAKKKGDTKTQDIGRVVKIFGEGDVCYSLPMNLFTMLQRVFTGTPWYDPGYYGRVGHPGSQHGQGGQPELATVVKL
jgi:hypothetical protein